MTGPPSAPAGVEVTVLIPTYNERENLRRLLPLLGRSLEGFRYEILVLDDSSPDGTADVALEAARADPSIHLVRRPWKEGLGAAYKDGISRAGGGRVVTMDADLSHDPADVPRLLKALEEGVDIAIGSRYVGEGLRRDPLHRRAMAGVGRVVFRVLLRSPVRDGTGGFRAYRAEVLRPLPWERIPDDFSFQAAVLFGLLRRGARAVEVPVNFLPRSAGKSKMGLRDLWGNGVTLLRLAFRRV